MTQLDLFKDNPVEQWIKESHSLLTRVVQEHSPAHWVPLLSGGHDSISACHVASLHPAAPRPFTVYHIDTGTGAEYTRKYIDDRCRQFGWDLVVMKSPDQEKDSYEAFVRERGFPGPAMHSWVYARLKERSIQAIVKEHSLGQRPVMLISGSRRKESQRRMGYALAVRRGDGFYDSGHLRNPSRLWVAPCIEWEPAHQTVYFEEFGIPRNKLKDLIGLSGECFCGANAAVDNAENANLETERELIRQHAPDVEAEIVRLEVIAKELGKPCKWGHTPPKDQDDPQEERPFCSMDLCIGCQK